MNPPASVGPPASVVSGAACHSPRWSLELRATGLGGLCGCVPLASVDSGLHATRLGGLWAAGGAARMHKRKISNKYKPTCLGGATCPGGLSNLHATRLGGLWTRRRCYVHVSYTLYTYRYAQMTNDDAGIQLRRAMITTHEMTLAITIIITLLRLVRPPNDHAGKAGRGQVTLRTP